MKLIQKLIEDGAAGAVGGADGGVGAHSVAAHATPLFAKLTKRELPIKIRIAAKPKQKKQPTKGLGIKEAYTSLCEMNSTSTSPTIQGNDTFDTTEVISKLKSLENKDSVDKHETQAFVLEDDDGNMVKIWVKSEEASNFEAALNAFLSQEDADSQRNLPEIAEIIFKLKNQFTIVDIAWPEVQEDEEQEQALAPGGEQEAGQEDLSLDPNDLDAGNATGDSLGGEQEVKGLLTQVIDMMKADAEARRAEAHARAAEAKARESELATQQVYAKVKQEEQILDMEAHDKRKKEADKEAKRLAQLARWKHEMETDEGSSFDDTTPPIAQKMGQENEETKRPASLKPQNPKRGSTVSGRVSPADVANYILNRVK